jgi:hypothetical protein
MWEGIYEQRLEGLGGDLAGGLHFLEFCKKRIKGSYLYRRESLLAFVKRRLNSLETLYLLHDSNVR